jgi:hypothetical protein
VDASNNRARVISEYSGKTELVELEPADTYLSEGFGSGIANDVILQFQILEAAVANQRRGQYLGTFFAKLVSIEIQRHLNGA